MAQDRTRFMFLRCPRCEHQFQWLGDRFPNYCPECGKDVFPDIKHPSCVLIDDPNAKLRYDVLRNQTTTMGVLRS